MSCGQWRWMEYAMTMVALATVKMIADAAKAAHFGSKILKPVLLMAAQQRRNNRVGEAVSNMRLIHNTGAAL